MGPRPFHLAWFLQGSSIQAWGAEWSGNISEDWMSAEMFVDLARACDRAAFDYLLLEDSLHVGQNWQDRRDIFLRNGMSVPRQEPTVVASLMCAATQRLGIIPTLSTFAYHPYLTARIVGTLDQVSAGRAGWNMVTGFSDLAPRNFGFDGLADHDTRYAAAEEYIQVVTRLWDSWEPGAIVADRESGVLIDPARVHTIDHVGSIYRSRGPLNSGPAPQGRPVIAQAGGSTKGKRIAGMYADTVVAYPKGLDGMRTYRDTVRAHMREFGRDPDDCKVLFLFAPVLGDTMAEAQEKAASRRTRAVANMEARLAQVSWTTNVDFSGFDLDAPLAELTTNGSQSCLANIVRPGAGDTLREVILNYSSSGGSIDLIGTPDAVSAQMGEVMQEVGGDGYLFSLPSVSRRSVAEITDGLVPALQQRRLVRMKYAHAQLRDTLLEF